MKLVIAADHAGFPLKEEIRGYLERLGHEVVDHHAVLARRVDGGSLDRGLDQVAPGDLDLDADELRKGARAGRHQTDHPELGRFAQRLSASAVRVVGSRPFDAVAARRPSPFERGNVRRGLRGVVGSFDFVRARVGEVQKGADGLDAVGFDLVVRRSRRARCGDEQRGVSCHRRRREGERARGARRRPDA